MLLIGIWLSPRRRMSAIQHRKEDEAEPPRWHSQAELGNE